MPSDFSSLMDLRRVVDSQLLRFFFVLVGRVGVTTFKLFPSQGRNGVLFVMWVSARSLSGHRSIVDFQLPTGVLADFPLTVGVLFSPLVSQTPAVAWRDLQFPSVSSHRCLPLPEPG